MADSNSLTDVSAPPSSVIARFSNKRLLQILGVILVLIVVVGAVMKYYAFDPQQVIEKAVMSFNNNDLASVLEGTEDILARDPDNIQALLTKAITLAQQGSLGFKEEEYGVQAIALAQQVLAKHPDHIEAMRIVGYSNEIMGRYDEALVWYDKALALGPKNAAIIAQKAHMYDLMGDRERADAGYAAALEVDPDITLAQLGAAKGYLRADKPDEARAMYEKAGASAENVRQKAEAYYSAGVVAGVQGDHAAAEQLMRNAIEADPTYALAWYGLANELNEKYVIDDGDTVTPSQSERDAAHAESFTALYKAIELNPQQTEAYLLLGTLLLADGDTKGAYGYFVKSAEVVKTDITLSEDERSNLAYSILLMNVMAKNRLGIE